MVSRLRHSSLLATTAELEFVILILPALLNRLWNLGYQ